MRFRRLVLERLESRSLLAGATLDLNVITHGFQGDRAFPGWVEDMALAMNERAGYGCTADEVRKSRMSHTGPSDPPAGGCPHFLLFDWAAVSIWPGIADNDEVAGALTDFVRARLSDESPTDLHFAGHSRGSFVVRAAISRLSADDHAKIGWLQMTTFDPQNFGTDGDLTVPADVDFADNYLQMTDGFFEPAGEEVPGAINVDLTEILDAWEGRSGSVAEHSEVHDWYHWTIDLATFEPGAANPYTDVPLATADDRVTLFPHMAWKAGREIGFYWSVAGGGADIFETLPWTNHVLRHDVNKNGRVSPDDAIQVINVLNDRGAGALPVPRPADRLDEPDLDVSRDNLVTALDVLLVINVLNEVQSVGNSLAAGRAEGESLRQQFTLPSSTVNKPLLALPPKFVSHPQDKDSDMLVLSRRARESVVVGEDVVVTVVKIRGNQVQLAFKAPREMAIHRKEIYEAIRREEDGAETPYALLSIEQ